MNGNKKTIVHLLRHNVLINFLQKNIFKQTRPALIKNWTWFAGLCLFLIFNPLHAQTSEIETKAASSSYSDNLWDYINHKSKLQHLPDDKIKDYLAWFENHPAYLTRISRRAQLYLYFVIQIMEAQNLPIELALLPVVESAYYPFSYSPDAASGLWQFIPSTGAAYGLKKNWWYDARRDVISSTKAAAKYFKNLSILFDGDILLILAAYNAGSGRLQKAIKKNKSLNKSTDFWHLSLPLETKNYVLKFFALKKIIANPKHYGQNIFAVPNAPVLASITLQSQLDVRTISELSGLDLELIYELNPGLNRWTTPPNIDYQLVLLKEVMPKFKKALHNLPLSSQLEWTRHLIKNNEKLTDIAYIYNLEVAQLKRINQIAKDHLDGNFFIIPILKDYNNTSYHTLSSTEKAKRLSSQKVKTTHLVRPGENLWHIAKQYRVQVASLIVWNKIKKPDLIQIGAPLIIWRQKKIDDALINKNLKTGVKITRKIYYQIRKGDTLSKLARRFKVQIADVKKWNNLASDLIKYGENLIIYVAIVR